MLVAANAFSDRAQLRIDPDFGLKSKGATPKKPVIVVILAIALMASLFAVPALASPWKRGCGTPRDGFLLTNETWEVNGPWQVGMSYRTAAHIARQVGPTEFDTPTTARDIPCGVAQNVSESAANAWLHWSNGDGIVGVRWIGYSGGPYLGRFTCAGTTQADTAGARETCHHKSDRYEGAMTVKFVIGLTPDSN
jgi:hypothetical protein